MGDESDGGLDRTDSAHGGIIRREISPDPETAEHALLTIIAQLEGKDTVDLPSLYHELDHVVQVLFRTPPSSDSQLTISFSYAGYRITMDQKGAVELLRVKDSLDATGE